jgi:hypothetical protein
MPEPKHITGSTPYASSGDFHRIFNQEKDSLYRLSFMLTADPEKAQRCFVSGLEDSVKGNMVFKEWARSWARRVIIQCAVRMIDPRPMNQDSHSHFNSTDKTPTAKEMEIIAVLELGAFERFVYVMSILELYSDQDCSLLLDCTRQIVIAARIRALQQIEMRSTFTLEQHVTPRQATFASPNTQLSARGWE